MWVSWFSDQIIQVRVLASPLPHSVKETRAFNAFQKDYLFLIPLKKREHLPSIRLSKMERIGHWINMSKMERIGYWIKSCLIFCSFLCLVIVFLPGYALSGNTIDPIEKIECVRESCLLCESFDGKEFFRVYLVFATFWRHFSA